MNRSLKMQLALGILSARWQAHARPAVAPAQPLGIHLYDLANISPHTLDEAAREAARVLATAGVEVVWQQLPADSPEAHASDQTASAALWRQTRDTRDYLVVRMVRGFPARALSGALGFSLPDAKAGAHATVSMTGSSRWASPARSASRCCLGTRWLMRLDTCSSGRRSTLLTGS
jgi:hypothetical protein